VHRDSAPPPRGANPPRQTRDTNLPILRGTNIGEHLLRDIIPTLRIYRNCVPRLISDPRIVGPGI
ncbi:hypothetical protein A2U01_0113463, partial [Trifolium medium]|nr:hypothetical protein [Trifolium medium]